jgi:hypothetical protein
VKLNWYFSLILSILALIGASQIDSSIPNQELIVEFSGETLALNEAQDAVENFKSQLEIAGASNIKVQRQTNRLRITYYSAKDIAAIKTVFSEQLSASFTENTKDSDLSLERQKDVYQLNFSELHKGNDITKDFNGQLVDIESTTIRFFNPFVYYSSTGINLEQQHNVVTTALKTNKQIALAIILVDYVIPEVRAGPLS